MEKNANVKKKKIFKDDLESTFKKYYPNRKFSRRNYIKAILLDEKYRFIYFFRKVQFLKGNSIIRYYIYRYIFKKMKIKYGVTIGNSMKIGKGFKIFHMGGIVINPDTIIGENFRIRQNTTIGDKGLKKVVQ